MTEIKKEEKARMVFIGTLKQGDHYVAKMARTDLVSEARIEDLKKQTAHLAAGAHFNAQSSERGIVLFNDAQLRQNIQRLGHLPRTKAELEKAAHAIDVKASVSVAPGLAKRAINLN